MPKDKVRSDDEDDKALEDEEKELMQMMDYLKKRLEKIREERAVITSRSEWRESLSSSSSSCAWSDETYYCPCCKKKMCSDELYHRTKSNLRYHTDCWRRLQEEWEKEYNANKVCKTCGKKYKEADGDTWEKSRKKKWYCGPCAKEAYCGQSEALGVEEDE
jgi:hypothetical protein